MLRLCCCWSTVTPTVHPAPATALDLDLVADLPPHTRNSSALTSIENSIPLSGKISPSNSDTKIELENYKNDIRSSRSPSIEIDEASQKSIRIPTAHDTISEISSYKNEILEVEEAECRKSGTASPASRVSSRRGSSTPGKSRNGSPASVNSGNSTPEPTSVAIETQAPRERNVKAALAECIVPARHEDWEAILTGLTETGRLAADVSARAPAASWRAATRGAAVHVKSLRSRVARVACNTVAALFEHRGKILEPELDEAATALLDRCADANRFLRGDAADALGRVACGSGLGRASVSLSRRGATHRAGPVRAAAASALARLVRHAGPSRTLDLAVEPRTVLLRAAGELLTDACPEARMHARHLVVALSDDIRFRSLLKDAMPATRYRAVEKLIDKLLCRL